MIGKQIVPVLIARLSSGPAAEREAALQAVGKAGLIAAPQLLAAIPAAGGAQRGPLLQALAATERFAPSRPSQGLAEPLAGIRQACVAPLIALLDDADRPTRTAALRYFALLEYGAEAAAAIPKLETALRDEDVAIRSFAAESLDRIKK